MEYNLSLSLFILTWVVPALTWGRWPTVLVCLVLRGFSGCGTFNSKTGKCSGNPNELVTQPLGAILTGSHVHWARSLSFCEYVLTFWHNKMFQAHLISTLTQPQNPALLQDLAPGPFVIGLHHTMGTGADELIRLPYRLYSCLPLHLCLGGSRC